MELLYGLYIYSGQNIGINIIDTTVITTVIPSPGLKKSINPRLPGRTTSVLVPEPTGVRNGQEAATQMATAIAAGFIFKAKAMGIKSGVTSSAVDVFIIILVSKQVKIKMTKSTAILLGCSPKRRIAPLLIINPAPLTSIDFDTALIPPTIKIVDQSMAL